MTGLVGWTSLLWITGTGLVLTVLFAGALPRDTIGVRIGKRIGRPALSRSEDA